LRDRRLNLSVMVQCFSITINQQTVLFSLTFQRNEQGLREVNFVFLWFECVTSKKKEEWDRIIEGKPEEKENNSTYYIVKDPNAFHSSPELNMYFGSSSRYNIIYTRIPHLGLPHFSNINC